MKYIIPLHCEICSNPVGNAEVYSEFGWDKKNANEKVYKEKNNVADMRCSACENSYGLFKELAEEFMSKTKKNWNEAENFIKKNRKKADFDKELNKLKGKNMV